MRKSWAEYKRNARKREKNRHSILERALNLSVFRRPFSNFTEIEARPGFGSHYLILGKKWWDFSVDDGIEPLDDEELGDDDRSAAFNSLGKAELVLSVLEDVVHTLAQDIAAYKRSEIETRISEIQEKGFVGTNAKASLDELERLKRMRHRLNKQVRRSLPQTMAAGL